MEKNIAINMLNLQLAEKQLKESEESKEKLQNELVSIRNELNEE